MHLPIAEAISFLKLLFDVYVYKKKTGRSEKSDPDPEKVQEVIEKLELKLEDKIPEAKDPVSTQIEETLPPEQAKTLKDDLALLEFVANPPTPEEYDYWGMLTQYVGVIRTIAIRSNLFIARGFKNSEGMRLLELPKTAVVLIPNSELKQSLVTERAGLTASVTKIKVLLTDAETEKIPLIVVVMASFERSSDGFGHVPHVGDAALFRMAVGQETNWLTFETVEREERFADFTYRLTASDLRAIISALRTDLDGYVSQSRVDREEVKTVRDEIKSLVDRLGGPGNSK